MKAERDDGLQERINIRTKVLMAIFEYQDEHGHGIGFEELVKKTGLKRQTVSKCHDSLSDMGIVMDVHHLESGMHKPIMEIPQESMTFVKHMCEKIKRGECP